MNDREMVHAIEQALHEVQDPETGINICDLGLVYGVEFAAPTGAASVTMTFTTPACPAGDVMTEGVERRLLRVPGVSSVDVRVVFMPPWTPERITPEGRAELGWR